MILVLVGLAAAFSPGAAFSPRATFSPRAARPLLARTGRARVQALSLTTGGAGLPPTGTKLDDFLLLLGRCYAVAGVAHALDFATTNSLPAMAAVTSLPPIGQAMGVLWCVIGAAQPLGKERKTRTALAAAYGAYEIVLTIASGAATSDPDGVALRLAAAAGLQAVVIFCYFELRRQSMEAAEVEARVGKARVGEGARSGVLRMALSEEELQARREEIEARLGAEGGGRRQLGQPLGSDTGGGVGGPSLPPLLGEVGLFVVVIMAFLAALVVSLS